jgi:EpsI family protein
MSTRRDFLIGGACVAAAGAAYSLKPRRAVQLLPEGGSLAQIVPAAFGDWRSEDVADPLAVNGEETLSSRLYNELVVRVYSNLVTADRILMLLAYGGRQTDELQLHRPEVCYPAFGYALTRNEPTDVPLSSGVTIPARRLLAQGQQNQEGILYWSRMGEFLPRSAGEQRKDRFRIALDGVIPDGLLSRFSTSTADGVESWARIGAFVPALVAAVAPAHRKVLIGSERARTMSV